MARGSREEPFGAFVAAYRTRLLGTAALVHQDRERAEAVADAALAEVYASWPRLDDPYAAALRLVLDPRPTRAERADPTAAAFELVDVAHIEARPLQDIRSELAALSADERRILVLARYNGLPVADISRVLRREPDDVRGQLDAAERRLQELPRRLRPRMLAAELATAGQVPERLDRAHRSDTAPRTGRSMLRLRRLRLVAVALALVVLAGFGIRQALPSAPLAAGTPAPASPDPGSVSTPAPCDTTQAACRADIVSAWRAEMADVISEYLDPKGRYFTGFSYSYTEDYQGSKFFDGPGGALALDLYRMREGATEVHLQIATSRRYAMRCGALTKRPCHVIRFMDGNNYSLTDPFDVAHGMEVQRIPEGTFVITVAARITSKAKEELPVTRADLVSLISDARLRPPPR